MEDVVDAVQQRRQVQVGQVPGGKCESRVVGEDRQVGALDGRVVAVGEAVDAGDQVAFGEEPLAKVRPDEAGGAGDERSGLAHEGTSGGWGEGAALIVPRIPA